MSTRNVRILAFAGSSRAGSYNVRLLAHAVELLRARGADVDVLDLGALDLPLYYADDEAAHGAPAGVQRLREAMRANDALLIASPEYNASVSGVLKNAIDWASRPPHQPLDFALLQQAGTVPVAGDTDNRLTASNHDALHGSVHGVERHNGGLHLVHLLVDIGDGFHD